MQWAGLTADEIAAKLGTDLWRGLTTREARQRLSRHHSWGERPRWQVMIRASGHQLASPLLYILLLAGGLSWLLGHERDIWLIGAMFVLNLSVGVLQEYKTDRALGALRNMVPHIVRVVRDGHIATVPAGQLVVGDIVVVEAGEKVPADIRLIRVEELEADESRLTGESLPVAKSSSARQLAGGEHRLQPNIIYWGSLVARGQARGVAVAVGAKVHFAKTLSRAESEAETKTGLELELGKLSRLVLLVSLGLVVVILGVSLWQKLSWQDGLNLMTNLFVAIIPEGLPVAATVILAAAALRMARHKALAHRLAAVETLGNIDLVLVGKTSTLTLGQMAVREIWTSNGTTKVFKDRSIDKEARNVILGSVLANQASLVHRLYATEGCGDGMDVALLKLGHRLGARPKLCLDALPFDHHRRYTASLCDISHRRQLFVKGAPEIILGKATRIASDGRKVKINQAQRDAFNSAYRHLAARGRRVLAVARKEMPKSVAKLSDHEVTDLVILGLVGIEDAPRRAARSVIDILRRTGIDVKMVTGDLPATAYAVAREVGLAQDLQGIVSGERVVKLLSRSHSLCGIDVFARVLPETKMAIVKHYQARGHRVAMIGDGINDVAALKVADIGVALVKQGAEVAQETADLAITDGNLATLKMALFEGREVWLKLRKVLFFLLSTNLAELAVVLVALLLGWPLPFTPVQILWINIITDLAIGQALIFGRGDLPMSFHGRELIPKWLGRQIAAAALWIAAVTLLVYHRFLALDSAAAATMAFVILIASQVANAYNGYALGASVFTVKWYRHFWIHLSAALVLFLTILSVNWAPLREFLGLASIGAGDFVRLVILGLSVVGFLEIAKLWYIKRKD